MLKKSLRVISLVPSWTETLVAAGLEVIGRTRFCIHPAHFASNCPSVGGTKAIEAEKIEALKPDFIILDQQENTKEMAEYLISKNYQVLVTNVTDFSSVIEGLRFLSQSLSNQALAGFAERYEAVLKSKTNASRFFQQVLIKGLKPEHIEKEIEYVIWKNPFMVIGNGTFISENLKRADLYVSHLQKYPTVDKELLRKKFCLFSSEPFPFLKNYDELLQKGFRGVVVDGEKLSWFGIRNLVFLESVQEET